VYCTERLGCECAELRNAALAERSVRVTCDVGAERAVWRFFVDGRFHLHMDGGEMHRCAIVVKGRDGVDGVICGPLDEARVDVMHAVARYARSEYERSVDCGASLDLEDEEEELEEGDYVWLGHGAAVGVLTAVAHGVFGAGQECRCAAGTGPQGCASCHSAASHSHRLLAECSVCR
jgi:hypothetical protein